MTGTVPKVSVSGLVLCGGRSTRMGTDKAWIDVGGEPLVVRTARLLAEVADPVLLAPGTPGRLGDLGYPEVADEEEDRGPLAGLVAGLRASPHEVAAVVAVDLPWLNPGLLAFLAGLWGDEDAVVPVTAQGPQPLHAIYARTALPALGEELAAGRLGLRAALSRLRTRTVEEREWRTLDPSGRFAQNLNTPEDLVGLGSTEDDRPTGRSRG
jgi:molybdenum cofactor guanylyltransferase